MSSTQTDIQQPVGKNHPRLVADIGGTNARFALETAPHQIEKAQVLPCKDYDTIVDAAKAYLEQAGGGEVRHAAFAGKRHPACGAVHQSAHAQTGSRPDDGFGGKFDGFMPAYLHQVFA